MMLELFGTKIGVIFIAVILGLAVYGVMKIKNLRLQTEIALQKAEIDQLQDNISSLETQAEGLKNQIELEIQNRKISEANARDLRDIQNRTVKNIKNSNNRVRELQNEDINAINNQVDCDILNFKNPEKCQR